MKNGAHWRAFLNKSSLKNYNFWTSILGNLTRKLNELSWPILLLLSTTWEESDHGKNANEKIRPPYERSKPKTTQVQALIHASVNFSPIWFSVPIFCCKLPSCIICHIIQSLLHLLKKEDPVMNKYLVEANYKSKNCWICGR